MDSILQMRKRRVTNFNQAEKLYLVELIKERRYILENKHTDGFTNRAKEAAWNEIAELFNSSPICTAARDANRLRSCWLNMKKGAKRRIIEDKHGLIGGITDPVSDQIDNLLREISCEQDVTVKAEYNEDTAMAEPQNDHNIDEAIKQELYVEPEHNGQLPEPDLQPLPLYQIASTISLDHSPEVSEDDEDTVCNIYNRSKLPVIPTSYLSYKPASDNTPPIVSTTYRWIPGKSSCGPTNYLWLPPKSSCAPTTYHWIAVKSSPGQTEYQWVPADTSIPNRSVSTEAPPMESNTAVSSRSLRSSTKCSAATSTTPCIPAPSQVTSSTLPLFNSSSSSVTPPLCTSLLYTSSAVASQSYMSSSFISRPFSSKTVKRNADVHYNMNALAVVKAELVRKQMEAIDAQEKRNAELHSMMVEEKRLDLVERQKRVTLLDLKIWKLQKELNE